LRWILELVTTKQKLDLAKAEAEEKLPIKCNEKLTRKRIRKWPLTFYNNNNINKHKNNFFFCSKCFPTGQDRCLPPPPKPASSPP
jgi:hypothetical protein